MIFKIADGREYFYQWDIDRQLIVSDPTIKEVHFCNRTDVCSLVVEVVDGVANVPNKVLQSGFDVRVFGYDGKATMHEATFEVKARTQPTDYVYTEVEIKRYSDLEKRIDEIEKEGISEEVITKAVNNYLDENPITMDGYATEEYVNEAVSNVKPDLTGLATEAYVDEAVKNAKVDVDLTDYAKKTDIPDVSKFISEIPSEYVTESELNTKGYATKAELNDKANTNHTHTGYAATNHTHSTADIDGLQKALNEKATQADIDKAIELHDHRYDYAPIDHNHDDKYAAKSHTHSYNNLLDKPTIPSVEGLASEAYVNAAVKNVKPDLTGYATEAYVNETINNMGPVTGDIEFVTINNNYEDIKAILDAGKWPVLKCTVSATLQQYILPFIRRDTKEVIFGKAITTANGKAGMIAYKRYLIETAKWESPNSMDFIDIHSLEVNPTTTTDTLTSITIDGVSYAIPTGGGSAEDCHVYVDETNSVEDIEAALAADKLPVYRHVFSSGTIQYLPLSYKQVYSDISTTSTAYYFSAKIALPNNNFDAEISCSLVDGNTVWSEFTTTVMQSKISVNTEPDPDQRFVPNLTYLKVDDRSYKIPETDLSNYYTKDETYSKAEVDEALANAGGSGGGSSGGSGKTQIALVPEDTISLRPEVRALLDEMQQYSHTGANPLEKYDLYYTDEDWDGTPRAYKATSFKGSANFFRAFYMDESVVKRIYYDGNGSSDYNARVFFDTSYDLTPKYKDWFSVSLAQLNYWVIGWCNELYLQLKITADGQDYYCHSYVTLCNTDYSDLLYDHTNERFPFTVPVATMNAPYWYWDGEQLVVEANGNTCELIELFVRGQYT